jgi:serine-type D-Ala-D-Ala carboxypeptidase
MLARVDDPVYDVGSVTKVVVTTALCMSLVDASRLGLDTPVRHWFDGFGGTDKDHVTVRDLLEHQGGLWEWWPTYAAGARSPGEALDLVQGLPLRYPQGSGRHYSDLGFMLLGEIVAREYGGRLDRIAERELFTPLGMRSTGYRAPGSTAHECLVPTSFGDWYERRMIATGSPYPVPLSPDAFDGWREHVLVGEANDGNCWHAFGGIAGHAGVFTTVADLLRFGQALLDSLDGSGPWSARVVSEFCSRGRDPAQGLGFRLATSALGPMVEHPGFPGARFAVLPDARRAVALLTNRLHTRGEPQPIDVEWSALLRAVEDE